jgi:type II secretory pathway predicted ATPase ExeA
MNAVAQAEPVARKVTPDTIRQIHAMTLERKTKREMSQVLDIGEDTLKRIRSGRYAHMDQATSAVWQELFGTEKPQQGANPPGSSDFGSQGAALGASNALLRPKAGYFHMPKKLAPASSYLAGAVPPGPIDETEKEDNMLLVCEGLKPETRKHFKLARNPFVDDIQTPADVFQTPSVRYVRAALTDCAQHHGFIAVVGESGAGKSTLAEDLQERIKTEGREIIIVKPFVLGMEYSDDKGKTLKATQIAEAIGVALDPSVVLKLSSEARFRQVHALLKASHKVGRRHLVVIEEAHCMPRATLKHLKRFLELKDGMQRLLGIALIAQPELLQILSSQNAEVREVAQRCEVVTLEPLDGELEGYLQHKFARFDLKLTDVFEPDAFDAIRARLIRMPRGGKPTDAISACYPLVVNNLVARAMNAAAKMSWPKVSAQVIAGC